MTVTLPETLAVFDRRPGYDPPLTTGEVADSLECTHRTARNRLETLVEHDLLETKPVSSDVRVWWVSRASGVGSDRDRTEIGSGDGESRDTLACLSENLPGVLYRGRHERERSMEIVRGDCVDLTGYEAAVLEAGDVRYGTDIVHPDDAEAAAGSIRDGLRTDGRFTVEYRIRTASGKTRWVWERGCRAEGRTGTDGVIEGAILDISARKRMERALREEMAFTSGLLDAQRDIVYTVGYNGRMLRWNDRLTDVTGYADDEVAEMYLDDFVSEPDSSRDVTLVDRIVGQGSGVTTELALVTSGGDRIPYEFSGEPVVDSDGEVMGITGVGRDVSARKRRERALERQRNELSMLDQINTLIDDIIEALVTASTRDSIEETVCTELSRSEFYADAWIAERSAGSGIAATSGTERDVDEELAVDIDRVMRENAPLVGRRPADASAADGASTEAGRETMLAPLSYGDTVYGVLVVEETQRNAFGESERQALGMLGDVIGFAINATTNRRLLLSDVAIELTLSLTDTDAFFVTLSDRLNCSITLEGVVPIEGQLLLCYVTVRETTPEAVRDEIPAESPIADPRVISRCGSESFLEFTIDGGSGVTRLVEYGATVRSMDCENGTGALVVRLPSTADVREAVAVFQETFPGTTLVGKRTVTLPLRPIVETRRAVIDLLTDRQRSILQAAFFAGYYESPRRTTAQELADSLGIASSTLHQHLQAAHSKLLEVVLEETDLPPAGGESQHTTSS